MKKDNLWQGIYPEDYETIYQFEKKPTKTKDKLEQT